jgi:hypothetical protein
VIVAMGGASLRPEDYDPRLNDFVLSQDVIWVGAADDAAALVFEGTELREVVCTEDGSTGYRVERDGETALTARLL